MHALIYRAAFNNRLHLCHLTITHARALRILDIGYGTGTWTEEMAKSYSQARITGIDLVPFLVSNSAQSIRNLSPVDFNTDEWPVEPASQDLIHAAQLAGSVSDWSKLYATAYSHLRPGTGQLELVEIDWTPRLQPFTPLLETDIAVREWWEGVYLASQQSNYPMSLPRNIDTLLETVGFVDIVHRKIQIPFAGTPGDASRSSISDWFQCSVGYKMAPNAFAALGLHHLSTGLDIGEVQAREMCADALRGANARGTGLYFDL